MPAAHKASGCCRDWSDRRASCARWRPDRSGRIHRGLPGTGNLPLSGSVSGRRHVPNRGRRTVGQSERGANKNGTYRRGNRHPLSGRRGRQAHLRLSGGRRSLHLRRTVFQPQYPAHPGASRAGCRPRGRRLLPHHAGSRCLSGDLRPRRHQRRHRHRHGLHGFGADGDHQRPGAHQCHWRGRLPGMRRGGHHPALRQAQLPGQGRARPGRHLQEGLPHCPYRPARSGAHRHPEGCLARPLRLLLPQDRGHALLQPRGQGAPGTAQEGHAAHPGGRAPAHLRGRRRHPGQCLQGAERAGRPAGLSVHHHAHGSGGLPFQRLQVDRHARHARHL